MYRKYLSKDNIFYGGRPSIAWKISVFNSLDRTRAAPGPHLGRTWAAPGPHLRRIKKSEKTKFSDVSAIVMYQNFDLS